MHRRFTRVSASSIILWELSVLPFFTSHLHLARLTRQQAGAIAAIAACGGVMAWWALTRRRVDPKERERARRTLLAESGRIIDGSITGIDGVTEDDSVDGTMEFDPGSRWETPHVLLYRYRIAGVTYECAQDVTALPEKVRNLRVDLPIQVRYDPQNPEDSIVVAEGWSGLQQDAVPDVDDLVQPPR